MQGTSRGGADIKEIVRIVELWGISMLFVIGGNGGQAAANAIHVTLFCDADTLLRKYDKNPTNT